jgi:hypothetical protein
MIEFGHNSFEDKGLSIFTHCSSLQDVIIDVKARASRVTLVLIFLKNERRVFMLLKYSI